MNFEIFYLSLGLLLIINLLVSIFLFKRQDLEFFQKISQSIILWLIPLLGAAIIYSVNKSHDQSSKLNGSNDTAFGADSSGGGSIYHATSSDSFSGGGDGGGD